MAALRLCSNRFSVQQGLERGPANIIGNYLLLRFIVRVLLPLLLLFFRFERFDGHFFFRGCTLLYSKTRLTIFRLLVRFLNLSTVLKLSHLTY